MDLTFEVSNVELGWGFDPKSMFVISLLLMEQTLYDRLSFFILFFLFASMSMRVLSAGKKVVLWWYLIFPGASFAGCNGGKWVSIISIYINKDLALTQIFRIFL